jgi:RNA polymerase sigma-B factor
VTDGKYPGLKSVRTERRLDTHRGAEPAPASPSDGLAPENELLRRYSDTRDEAARDELVRRFLPFARSLALRYSGGGEPSDDLVQVANVGLMAALERFRPERGVPFAAFAGPTILGELRRHFRDRVWTMRVPRGLQERIREIDEAIAKLSNFLEHSPTVSDLAKHLDLREDEVLEAFAASDARRTVSLDRPPVTGDGDEAAIAERIGNEDPGFELVEDRSALQAGIGNLSEIEREVLRLRFVEDLTQSRIAEQVGYSQMHVSRIIRRALTSLREVATEQI